MSITIGNYQFDGPFDSITPIRAAGGIYAILDKRSPDTGPYVLDIGESGDVHSRLATHDRAPQWGRACQGKMLCAVLYTPGWTDFQRRAVESTLRQQYVPPCGDH